MNIYPAIDLYQGRVVRLRRGDFSQETVYADDPASQAAAWVAAGAEWLHVVDLEGAKTGSLKNQKSLLAIRKRVKAKIQFGGGIRTVADIEFLTGEGINRLVLGTKALEQSFFSKVLARFQSSIAVGLDVRMGEVRTEGWLKASGMGIRDILMRFRDFPLETVIYTNIQKDGMLEGPDFDGLRQVLEWTQAKVILSGGIAGIDDIKRASKLPHENFDGVIIGKALYDRKVSLAQALKIIADKDGG